MCFRMCSSINRVFQEFYRFFWQIFSFVLELDPFFWKALKFFYAQTFYLDFLVSKINSRVFLGIFGRAAILGMRSTPSQGSEHRAPAFHAAAPPRPCSLNPQPRTLHQPDSIESGCCTTRPPPWHACHAGPCSSPTKV
jgi:hypothetical protein